MPLLRVHFSSSPHPSLSPCLTSSPHTSHHCPLRARASPASLLGIAGQFHFLLLPTGSNLLAPLPTQNIPITMCLTFYFLAFLMFNSVLWLYMAMFFLKRVAVHHLAGVGHFEQQFEHRQISNT